MLSRLLSCREDSFFSLFFYLWLNFIVAQTGKQIVLGTKNEEKRKSLFLQLDKILWLDFLFSLEQFTVEKVVENFFSRFYSVSHKFGLLK